MGHPARITEQGATATEAWATFKSEAPIAKAELCYTSDTGKWQDRKWEQLPAQVDPATGRVTASIPADAKVFYINLFDNRDYVVSTEHVDR